MIEQIRPKPSAFDDFMDISRNMDDEVFGARYCKMADKVVIVTTQGVETGLYCGEWSTSTHKPHGRGIFVNEDGSIRIKFFN